MAEVLIGGCLWGAVRYRITGAPVEALYCHCAMWRRGHGAPVVAWLTVPLNGSTVTAGRTGRLSLLGEASFQAGVRKPAAVYDRKHSQLMLAGI
jgi:hypothetical protein